jgi:hypothetical protein
MTYVAYAAVSVMQQTYTSYVGQVQVQRVC